MRLYFLIMISFKCQLLKINVYNIIVKDGQRYNFIYLFIY